jgi:hypothetical protein
LWGFIPSVSSLLTLLLAAGYCWWLERVRESPLLG